MTDVSHLSVQPSEKNVWVGAAEIASKLSTTLGVGIGIGIGIGFYVRHSAQELISPTPISTPMYTVIVAHALNSTNKKQF